MKIVVLDGYAMNPGDLSWDDLKVLGDVDIYDRTPADLIVERSQGAQVLITNKVPLWADTIDGLPDLRYIGVTATGYNVVDMEAASIRGITVTNVPAYSTKSVAQMVFAYIMEHCHHVQAHSDAVHDGEWTTNPDFTFWKYPQIELDGKTMGIIGFGAIGNQVAKIASVFGMHVLVTSLTKKDTSDIPGVEWVELTDLLRRSDFISLHAPLTPDTEGMINTATISLMKYSAFLINTGRGPLIVEADLAEALNVGRIAGAAMDVLSTEPPRADNPLLTAKNCIITPHIAWATMEARIRLMNVVVGNLQAYLSGHPVNVVSSHK